MHYLPALLFDLVLLEFPNVSFEMYSSFCVCLCDLSKGSSSFCFIQRIKSWSVELILRQTDKTKCISEKQKEKRKSLFLLILLSTHNQIHSERDFGFIPEPITFDTWSTRKVSNWMSLGLSLSWVYLLKWRRICFEPKKKILVEYMSRLSAERIFFHFFSFFTSLSLIPQKRKEAGRRSEKILVK